MPRQVKVNSLYKHFKGHIYKVIAIAKDTTDETLKVVYQNVATKDTVSYTHLTLPTTSRV